MAIPGPDAADAMPEIRPVKATGALNRTIPNREHHTIALAERHNHRSCLHARSLLHHHEFAFLICISAHSCVLSNTFDVDRRQLLKRLDKAWQEFRQSYAGLSDSQMLESGVTGAWSAKDILAHVTTWEAEALKNLPLILKGERPPPYSATYGGIHAFNARMTEQKRSSSLSEVLRQLEETHARLLVYIDSTPESQFTNETRFRRLRLDTYSHYPKHTEAIRKWRERRIAM